MALAPLRLTEASKSSAFSTSSFDPLMIKTCAVSLLSLPFFPGGTMSVAIVVIVAPDCVIKRFKITPFVPITYRTRDEGQRNVFVICPARTAAASSLAALATAAALQKCEQGFRLIMFRTILRWL